MTSRLETPDTPADEELRQVLDQNPLVAFTVVAGAGSGKTTSLVKALSHLTRTRGPELAARTQRIACVTYTEVAAQEIYEDIGSDPLASVSTIHSFLWSLAKPFQRDISNWVGGHIEQKIHELEADRAGYTNRTRATTKEKNAADLEKRTHQAEAIAQVDKWTYGIGGDYARGVLGHADILKMVPHLIIENHLMARLVARQFPFIFVDESQDTFPDIVDSLKHVWRLADGKMCLGFFGDPMQQIYQQGVGAIHAENGWRKIDKPQNFRSSARVLSCVNAVRSQGDVLQQVTGLGNDQSDGEAFCFILPADEHRSDHLERVRAWLDERSAPGLWTRSDRDGGAKVLMIVHRMAARRLGFDALYAAFNDNGSSSLKQSFEEGSAWPLAPFRDVILPLCSAELASSPAVLKILRKYSPPVMAAAKAPGLRDVLADARVSVEEMRELASDNGATLGGILRFAADRRLLEVDPRLAVQIDPGGEHRDVVVDAKTEAVLGAMWDCRLSSLDSYYSYIRGESPYSTQHGTKGAEFARVVVVMDDEEGRYFLYSYDKLLGLKQLTPTDVKNQADGVDSVIERTRRLLYVCVSRATDSLAIVLFSTDVKGATDGVVGSAIGDHVQIVTAQDLIST